MALEQAVKVSKDGLIDVNIDTPRYDQSEFSGRAKHFFAITNPLNLLLSPQQLETAKDLILHYRSKSLPDGTTENDLWQAKNRYDSAFHPDTGEKMMLIGRMSAQVPMNMTITGCMMTFYKTTPAVICWQWINQSFNAIVNYTNRSGDSPIPVKFLATAYVGATVSATATALGLNALVKSAPPLIGRMVPFCAVAAANCVNIPCMRFREIQNGIPVFTEDGTRVGESTKASSKAIPMVLVSRIAMAMPGMVIPPLLMNRLDKGSFLKKFPWANAPVQVMACGLCLVFATPLCCALFPQKSSMKVTSLELELQEKLKSMGKKDDRVFFNKGL